MFVVPGPSACPGTLTQRWTPKFLARSSHWQFSWVKKESRRKEILSTKILSNEFFRSQAVLFGSKRATLSLWKHAHYTYDHCSDCSLSGYWGFLRGVYWFHPLGRRRDLPNIECFWVQTESQKLLQIVYFAALEASISPEKSFTFALLPVVLVQQLWNVRGTLGQVFGNVFLQRYHVFLPRDHDWTLWT